MTEQSPETVLYKDDKAMISDRRIILSGTTYSLNNVTSVSAHILTANKAPAIIVGFVAAGLAVCMTASADMPGLTIGLAVVCIAGGGILASQMKDRFAVRIGTAGGESNAIVADEKIYVEKLVEAINNAMVKRS